ncbi:hypothetical protein ACRS5S_09450 [Nocardia asiatica]|uniref:hypothetical protein n=1 Tax=Nocardia asiatica TaxID=209252 RepID=UPI0024554D10|nr:hypothetical protein [Nocardia asiatica]
MAAPGVADVVRYAGGWLFDRTVAGWEVAVLVSDHPDTRPLRILGATVLDLDQFLAAPMRETWPHAIAVASEMYLGDSRIRDGVLDCLDRGLTEVTMWGEGLPAELDHRVGSVQHRVSLAGRAFKARALQAAGLATDVVSHTEAFRAGESPMDRRFGVDLVPAG